MNPIQSNPTDLIGDILNSAVGKVEVNFFEGNFGVVWGLTYQPQTYFTPMSRPMAIMVVALLNNGEPNAALDILQTL